MLTTLETDVEVRPFFKITTSTFQGIHSSLWYYIQIKIAFRPMTLQTSRGVTKGMLSSPIVAYQSVNLKASKNILTKNKPLLVYFKYNIIIF